MSATRDPKLRNFLMTHLVKSESYRDTRGPGAASITGVIRSLAKQPGRKAARDKAIVCLAYTLALRRSELVSLDVEHLDLEAGRVSIMGKARSERDWRTLPQQTIDALRDWLLIRREAAGPLFTSLDRAGKGNGRLSGSGLWAGRFLGSFYCGIRVQADSDPPGGNPRHVVRGGNEPASGPVRERAAAPGQGI